MSSGLAAITAKGASSGHLSKGTLPPGTWQTVEAVRAHADLPVVFRGVLTGEDVRCAAKAGVDGDRGVQPRRPDGWTAGTRTARRRTVRWHGPGRTRLGGHGSQDPEPAAAEERGRLSGIGGWFMYTTPFNMSVRGPQNRSGWNACGKRSAIR
ncbi:alpha-hydroxy-acid oxidizing protein [Kibdelosporangium aridum]|uniref:alpha-hydroxy-acid oxidizing protein n=1 Tax=Kibdelosporangium aridum TaxID=2030 RepID=UPI001F20E96E|nr:alpha-hydroxy-acid oxidizing protein [Kibdelosporangium aridum]